MTKVLTEMDCLGYIFALYITIDIKLFVPLYNKGISMENGV